jgi:hypothetical protein
LQDTHFSEVVHYTVSRTDVTGEDVVIFAHHRNAVPAAGSTHEHPIRSCGGRITTMHDDDPRGALVYAAAVRTLDQQADVVESIRTRAGTLLSAASIATAFLAGFAIRKHDGLSLWTGLASGAFGVVVGLCLAILLPTRGWTFRFNAQKLVANCLDVDPPVPLAKMHRDLSIQMEKWSQKNKGKLDTAFILFWAASIALAVEVAFWITDLVLRR